MVQRKAVALDSPLLQSSVIGTGTSSTAQTLGNIIVSLVGTGVLGLPYAFKIAGWFAGSLGVILAGVATYYCMILLVRCKDKLAAECSEAETYGDLGYVCMGKKGRYLTELLICVAQCGGSVAYLVFIGKNLSASFKGLGLGSGPYIFMLIPIQIALSWIRSLSSLAPFSIFADICNVLAMAFVVKEDVQQALRGEFSFSDRQVITPNIGGLPFAAGMAVFCFEGFGMTLALESSMRDKSTFRRLLGQALAGIISVYVLFGFLGYMAYGDDTKDIITLNLPHNWVTMAVQIGLSLALTFTFPIMLHPINEIIEERLKNATWFQKLYHNGNNYSVTRLGQLGIYISRAIVVMLSALLASSVPGFGVFSSLVGSTVCALISFVLPASFHLTVFGSSLQFWQRALDYFILSMGLLVAVYGTYNAIIGV